MEPIRSFLKSLLAAAAVCGASSASAGPPAELLSAPDTDARFAALQSEVASLRARLEQGGTAASPAPVVGTAPITWGGGCGCQTECPQPGWMIHGDWLYWKAHRGGLDYAIVDRNVDPIFMGDVARIRPDHHSGYRLGLFRQTASGIDWGFRYTDFDADETSSFTDPAGVSQASRIHPDASADVFQDVAAASANYDLNYQLLDFEAGYRLAVNCDSSVRPFVGFRIAYIDQQMDALYADAVDFSGDVVLVSQRMSMDAWGLYGGSEGRWALGGTGLHIFGRGAVGLHHARFEGFSFEQEVDDDTFNLRVSDGDRRLAASIEAQLGLGYQVYEGCRGAVDVQAGYDLQKWFNMAEFIRFHDDVVDATLAINDTSLSLDGWFVRLLVTR
jgi:uncharacterized small protein (DUF1192 family)